jgi:hypothetical protein
MPRPFVRPWHHGTSQRRPTLFAPCDIQFANALPVGSTMTSPAMKVPLVGARPATITFEPFVSSERLAAAMVSITLTFANETTALPAPVDLATENESLTTLVTGRPSELADGNTSTSRPPIGMSTRRPTLMSALDPATARSKRVALVK